jgi:ribonuclease P protein component
LFASGATDFARAWPQPAGAGSWLAAEPKDASACLPRDGALRMARVPARLKRRAEFLRAAAGRKCVTPGLILQLVARPAGEPESCRVGFTVSRKVGNSVARNRARRRLKAAAAAILPGHGLRGVDLVLIGRRETLTRPYAELLNDLGTAMKRLGIYQETAGAGA